MFFQKYQEFSGEFFDIPEDNVILNSIRMYEDHSSFSKPVEYVIISNSDSTKIRIIPNSTYSSYIIYYNCVEEKYSKLKKRNSNSITSKRRFFTGEYLDIGGDILLNSIQMFEFSQVDPIINLVPYVIISNKFSNKIRIVPYSDCKNYMIINKYVEQ